MNLKYMLLVGILLYCQLSFGQKSVSITIDDVPNSSMYEKEGYSPILLQELDSLKIPIAIFINEGLIYKTDSISKNFELLDNWSRKEYITLGNHSFNHYRYSTTGIELYKSEITKGESITRGLAKKHNKQLRYFRFPFNDLGKDSLQHSQIIFFLKENNYVITPFTVESSDWMFNFVYEYYLENEKFQKAEEIGEEYITKTLEYFDFFDKLAREDYKRPIHQIYLCHDNKINADFLPKLIAKLKKKEYKFISLAEALTDKVYSQKDNYFQKWGISWLYRWKTTQNERIKLMKKEPSTENIIELYQGILKEKKQKK